MMDMAVLIGTVTMVSILYIMSGGMTWMILDHLDFDDDAAVLCAIGWPLTAAFWAVIGFIWVVLFIPKTLFKYALKLKKMRIKPEVLREVK